MRQTCRAVRTVLLSILFFAASTGALFAQTPPYERVLFPIVTGPYAIPGANGSLWLAEQRVLNRSGADVTLYGGYVCFMCAPKYGPTHFSPGASYFSLPLLGNSGIPGSFLFIDRSAMNDVTFSSRIRDTSRTDRSFGTELPVVREAQFSASRIDLLGVPTDSRFRRTLRVYASTETGGAIAVRVFSEGGATSTSAVGPEAGVPDPLVTEQTFALAEPPAGVGNRENLPAFVSIGEIPEIGSISTTTARLEIAPLTPGLRIWAFVSVTNNDTQQVTIVSPQ